MHKWIEFDMWSECYRSVNAKDAHRELIRQQTEVYFANGGKIQLVDTVIHDKDWDFKTKRMRTMDKKREKLNSFNASIKRAKHG